MVNNQYCYFSPRSNENHYNNQAIKAANAPSFTKPTTQPPAAYVSNMNTSQQEIVRLYETYAQADMKEIQNQIKNCEI
jgi:hypothetical protein